MSELRQSILTSDWVVIASERAKRPHSYSRETKSTPPQTVLDCPFCPGNESLTPPEVFALRDQGGPDTSSWAVRVVPNKFPAFAGEAPPDSGAGAFQRMLGGVGRHEVIIHGQDHGRSLAQMTSAEIGLVFSVYQKRLAGLSKDKKLAGAIVIVNHGREAGASIEHPHSQLFAIPIVAPLIGRELANIRAYEAEHGSCLICDMVADERATGVRVVFETERFIVFCPFAGRVPFEMYMVPKAHQDDFLDADQETVDAAASAVQKALARVDDRLGDVPYNLYLHTRPFRSTELFHWHISILPKTSIVAGFEFGADIMINVVDPQVGAEFLR